MTVVPNPSEDGERRLLASLSPNLVASLLMVLSFLVFSMMAVFMREVGDTIHVVQVILVRQVVAMVLMSPWFWRDRAFIRRPRGFRLHLMRGILAVVAMSCGLTSILHISFADATAIQMSEVLIATALAALVLKEHVGWRRWTATAIGFVGVLIMTRPFGGGFDPYALVALAGAAAGGAGMITVRLGSAYDRTSTVLFWQAVVVIAVVGPVASLVWVTPTQEDAVLLIGMALIFAAGNWLFTSALRLGDTAAIAPLHYLRLIIMAGLGWWIYAEVPSLTTVIGAVLVLGAASYTIGRNARKKSLAEPDGPLST
ncbi:DMT family transporter [Pannonibacter tanglangensis]|uniref:EamA family transporter n=1 Tax=Pannonibacter tanglangensis TaxID=2750084 RepID=A0ABW9ZQ83_9HYPH|nr:DMT family transporter [Pannonibacter sp. XCT-34]NBN65129.1 EamA family transporter [Pannonibacter sp. XCT-34]